MVKIGQALSDEKGRASGGKAGNQNGKELNIRDWYPRNKGWTFVIRPIDSDVAETMAVAMEQACANPHIGYDQNQRTTLFFQAKNCDWDISKINVDCETDCSALIAVCANAAGIQVSKDIYTGNEAAALKATGAFHLLTDKKYTDSSDYLMRGDILLGPGHTAMVLSDGSMVDIVTLDIRRLQKGLKGADVKALQILLTGYGYDPNGIDGSFGNGCQKAVKAFQKDFQLEADGIVGRQTWKALLGL